MSGKQDRPAHCTRVFIPGINDDEIPKLISVCRRRSVPANVSRRLGIQKFEHYRYGRSPKGVKAQSVVAVLQPEYQTLGEGMRDRLRLDPAGDFGTARRPFIPLAFQRGTK